MRMIDMHVHSTCSDGTYAPERLASAAAKRGLSLLALTDHDTTSGLARFMQACRKEGVRGLCGVELSAEAPYTLHILGYRIRPGSAALEGRLSEVRDCRNNRNVKICANLHALGFDIEIDEVEKISGGEVVARPHIARLMVQKGYVPTVGMAFIKYLDRNGAAYVPRVRLSAEECISLIREAGGVAVLAHPAQCRLNDAAMDALLARLKAAGLWGLEAVYGANPPELTMSHLALAAKFGLYTTAGSDFHGANRPEVDLGIAVGDALLPWARLESR
ncbi:MAG: PHP domain-containing protein [Cloacibacillus sp.]